MSKELNVITKTYDLILWIFERVSKFPKNKQYSIGSRIEEKILSILESLIKANYTRDKIDILSNTNIGIEQLRYLIRLCKDLRLLSFRQYEFASKEINEIGKLLGGWIKQQKQV